MIIENSAKNTTIAALAALANGGSITLCNAADGVLATITLNNPAFGTPSAGVAAVAGPLSATVGLAGTISKAKVYSSASALLYTCTVGLSGSGADIEISSLVVTLSQTVTIISMTLEV